MKAVLEIVNFNTTDIVTTSDIVPTCPENVETGCKRD